MARPDPAYHADATPADAPLRDFVGYLMKRAFNVVRADLNACLAPFELRMITYSALAVIVGNPGLRQFRLAETLAMEPPNIVTIVGELERRGLIARLRVPEDRRAFALTPTPAGTALWREATKAVTAHDLRMTSGMSAEQREALVEALRIVEAAKEGDSQ